MGTPSIDIGILVDFDWKRGRGFLLEGSESRLSIGQWVTLVCNETIIFPLAPTYRTVSNVLVGRIKSILYQEFELDCVTQHSQLSHSANYNMNPDLISLPKALLVLFCRCWDVSMRSNSL